MEEFIEKKVKEQLYKCFNVYGIEGTLEKIESLYSEMPNLRELWLAKFYKIIKGDKDGNY